MLKWSIIEITRFVFTILLRTGQRMTDFQHFYWLAGLNERINKEIWITISLETGGI